MSAARGPGDGMPRQSKVGMNSNHAGEARRPAGIGKEHRVIKNFSRVRGHAVTEDRQGPFEPCSCSVRSVIRHRSF